MRDVSLAPQCIDDPCNARYADANVLWKCHFVLGFSRKEDVDVGLLIETTVSDLLQALHHSFDEFPGRCAL